MMIEAMKQALEALEWNLVVIEDYGYKEQLSRQHKAIVALRQAIAEAEKQQDIFKQLGSQSMLQLWQSYCDVKVERDELKDKLAEAEKQDHIEQHLEMVEQEPTCKQGLQVWVISNCKGAGQFSWEPQDEKFWTRMVPVNTHPPKREPLTDEEIATISVECATVSPSDIYFARAIEAAHGIGEKK
jgi:hypothetical protein